MNTTAIGFASNKVRDVERYYHAMLDQQYGEREVAAMLRCLFEAFQGWDNTQYLLHRSDTVNQSVLLKLHHAAEELRYWRPVQYIVGYSYFAGCRIQVDERVLVPRPETEEMVQGIVDGSLTGSALCATGKPPRIIDLCTGSGCIAVALAKACADATVVGVDLSNDCLAVARANAANNGVDVLFERHDVLRHEELATSMMGGGFDLIVSNPPYVCDSERTAMSRNVTDHEPAAALFVPDADPLCFYRAVAGFGLQRLSPDGLIVVEINENLPQPTLELFKEYGYTASLHSDFRDKPRFIVARRGSAF